MSAIDRFWKKVTKQGPDDCWPWTGYVSSRGYGYFAPEGGRQVRMTTAHRAAYDLLVAPVSAGMVVDHICHNRDDACPGGPSCPHRRCVNPAHLELTTPRENQRRGRPPGGKPGVPRPYRRKQMEPAT